MKKYNVSADWLIGGEAFNVGRNLAVGKIVVLPVLSARRRRIFDEQGWAHKVRRCSMTNLIEIKFDIDKYIADGGKLLDLTMPLNHPLSEQWLAQWVIAETAEDSVERAKLCARIERYGEWVGRTGERAGHEQKVGDVLTEDDVRSIWEQTKGA